MTQLKLLDQSLLEQAESNSFNRCVNVTGSNFSVLQPQHSDYQYDQSIDPSFYSANDNGLLVFEQQDQQSENGLRGQAESNDCQILEIEQNSPDFQGQNNIIDDQSDSSNTSPDEDQSNNQNSSNSIEQGNNNNYNSADQQQQYIIVILLEYLKSCDQCRGKISQQMSPNSIIMLLKQHEEKHQKRRQGIQCGRNKQIKLPIMGVNWEDNTISLTNNNHINSEAKSKHVEQLLASQYNGLVNFMQQMRVQVEESPFGDFTYNSFVSFLKWGECKIMKDRNNNETNAQSEGFFINRAQQMLQSYYQNNARKNVKIKKHKKATNQEVQTLPDQAQDDSPQVNIDQKQCQLDEQWTIDVGGQQQDVQLFNTENQQQTSDQLQPATYEGFLLELQQYKEQQIIGINKDVQILKMQYSEQDILNIDKQRNSHKEDEANIPISKSQRKKPKFQRKSYSQEHRVNRKFKSRFKQQYSCKNPNDLCIREKQNYVRDSSSLSNLQFNDNIIVGNGSDECFHESQLPDNALLIDQVSGRDSLKTHTVQDSNDNSVRHRNAGEEQADNHSWWENTQLGNMSHDSRSTSATTENSRKWWARIS
ncbi:hypothetical protein FGO68_gene1680 [Halteria grandinella]|uniref:Uncharacterized protein n=1 Tax=Halteria grandinella TaxID=5974 RepID=A0A8J8P0A8_HALGN|nr:hypothetical protein FGO68_gene1680 [Halteria grandinella]